MEQLSINNTNYIKQFLKIGTLLVSMLLFIGISYGQEILRGKIIDETGIGLPMAEVYVKNMPELRVRADIEGNYLMRLQEGEYYMVFQAMGYELREVFVVVNQGGNLKDVQLFPIDINELDELTVAVKKTNPGREIIKKVVEIKDQLDFNQYAYSANVYIKAKEIRTESEKKESRRGAELEDEDPFNDEEMARLNKLGALQNINLVEVDLQRDYAPPMNVREFRNAYTKRGNDSRLYYTTTVKSNINFFKNMLYLDDLNESPIQSPISTAGILSYKYRLVEKTDRNDGTVLNKIKIIPRSSATSTLEGFIWVQDSTWLIEKIDLTLVKGNLYMYDYFQVIQDFDVSSDTLCLLTRQEMNYGVAYKDDKYTASTIAVYSKYNFTPNFPPKHFGNEVAVTTKEAYERDTSYWSQTRMTPLTEEEINYIKKRDSIENLFTQTSYLDSVDSVFNEVTFLKVLWFGIDHRNRAKKTQWTLSSLAAMTRPVYIAGPRIGPDFYYFKKWKDERNIDIYSRVDVGLLNKDIKGRARVRHMYNPFNFGSVGFYVEEDYDLIRSFDAFTQVLLRDNFIESTKARIFHSIEITNGLFLDNNFNFANRRPIGDDVQFITWFDEALENNDPPKFEAYNAFIADMTLSYTPFQKYMREPNRKVILGSRWPTFYLYYEKGIQGFLNSDVNHDYLRLGIQQNFKIGTMGTTNYHATGGAFLNSKNLREFDYKFHRRSDPIWFSNPLFSFQDLDTALPTLDWYFEAHLIHHFNGALINKIPFMKKTRIMSVAGTGYLFVPEHNWHHYEFFAGLERIFKFSKRRLRIGLYAVLSDGNQITPRTSYKISFALLDRRDMKFNF